MPIIIIVSNFLLYACTTLFFYYKEGVTVRSFLWAYLTLFTMGSVYLLGTGLYFDVMDYPHFKDSESIEFYPYLLNYAFCFILLSLASRIKIENLNIHFKYTNSAKQFIRIIVGIEIIYLLLKLSQVTITFSFGFGNFHELGEQQQNAILYGWFPLLRYVNYMGKFVNITIMPYLILYHFYGYKYNQISYKRFLFIFILFAINTLLVGVVSGSRASLFFGIMDVAFFVILLYRYLNKRIIRKIIALAIIILSALLLVTKSITDERFRQAGVMTIEENIARYLGEANLNLTYEYFNHLFHHTEGKCVFPEFFNKQVDITNIMGTHVEWFKTAYGCLYIDYGEYMPLILCLILVIIFGKIVRSKGIETRDFMLLYYYYTWCHWLPFNLTISPFDIFILLSMVFIPMYIKKNFEIQ